MHVCLLLSLTLSSPRSTMTPAGPLGLESRRVMVDLSKVKNSSQWPELRQQIEAAVLEVLGQLPQNRVELQLKTVDEIEYPGYVRRRVNYFVDSWDRIAAWLFIPEGKEEAPAILCCHQEIRSGKDEPAGLDGESR